MNMDIECCDHESGQWLRANTIWDNEKCGHLVNNLIPGHTYSFRVLDTSLSLVQLATPSLPSSLVTIPHETGSWQQDHLLRRYYRFNKIIGRGRNSCIEEAHDNGTGQKVALKQIERHRQTQFNTRNEYKILSSISHQNIIHSLALFENAPLPGIDTIVLELVIGEDICSFICDFESVEMTIVQSLFNQLMSALDFLKEKNITHCDIKPENLMVETLNNKKNYLLKLVDFGSSVADEYQKYPYSITLDLEFSAPELLRFPPLISNAADVWSAGVVLYILLSGVSPFLDDSSEETVAHIENRDFSFPEEYFSNVPDSAKDLISNLLILKSTFRLTPADVLQSIWIKEDYSDVTILTTVLKSFIQRRIQRTALTQHIVLSYLKTIL